MREAKLEPDVISSTMQRSLRARRSAVLKCPPGPPGRPASPRAALRRLRDAHEGAQTDQEGPNRAP
eukprot:1882028-Pyramimonas_sp.AAC.1